MMGSQLKFSIFSKLILILVVTVKTVKSQESDIIERSQELSDRVSVNWIVDFTKESVTFQVSAETHGFVGFGLSPQGGMNGADVIIGRVLDDGTPYFTDRFATGKMEPKIDDHQDWFLLDAFENATHTVLTFNRSINTCDPEDLPITEDTTKFIWSLGSTDQIIYHEQRGAASTLLLDPPLPAVDISMYDIWKIHVNTTIPSVDTSYWCTVHKSPAYDSKRHIVGFKVDLESPLAVLHNHHLVLHKCLTPSDSDVGEMLETLVGTEGADCYEDIEMAKVKNVCDSYLYVWAKGGDPLFLPFHVGLPINEGENQEYFLLEIHYDNPQVAVGVQYDTGVEIYTTTELRDQDAGMLMVGHSANIALVVPPESEKYVIVGHCSPRCTAAEIPQEGLNIFNMLLHSHLSGRQLKLRHFRPGPDGQFKELPWNFDSNYDFNYQQNRPLKNYMKLMPGDQLTFECVYNSTWRDPPSVTLGGQSTRHEMCEAFLMYYPRNYNLDICASQFLFENLVPKVGIEEWDETSDLTDPTVLKPDSLAGKNLSTVLNEFDWTDEFRDELQQMARYDDQFETCFSYFNYSQSTNSNSLKRLSSAPNDYEIFYTNYPANYEAFVPPQQCGNE